MANNTTEAVTLTSKRVVCIFPSLGLMHQCAYPFDGIPDRTRTNGSDCIASHVLPGQYPLAKATRSELGRKRLLGDEQCFIIPLCADPGGKSEWSMEIRPQGGVTWSFDRGIVTSPWRSAKSTMAIQWFALPVSCYFRDTRFLRTDLCAKLCVHFSLTCIFA